MQTFVAPRVRAKRLRPIMHAQVQRLVNKFGLPPATVAKQCAPFYVGASGINSSDPSRIVAKSAECLHGCDCSRGPPQMVAVLLICF